jgi:hypothetical protein
VSDCVDNAGTPYLDVEMQSNNIDARDSLANLFTAWLGHHWTEMFTIFMMQAKTAEQERTGGQDVVENTPGPKLLGADSNVITVDSQGDARLPQAPAFVFTGASA